MTDILEAYKGVKKGYIKRYGERVATEIMVKTVLAPGAKNRFLTSSEVDSIVAGILKKHGVTK